MAFPEYPINPVPEEPLEHTWEPEVDVIQFGDGYTQRHVLGILANTAKYMLIYNSLTQAERDVIYNFVTSMQGGSAFTYKFDLDPAPRVFIAPEALQETRKSGNLYDVRVTLQEIIEKDE